MTSCRSALSRLATTAALCALAWSSLSCGPAITDARRLWLDSPRDGTLTLEDHEPPPF